MNWISTYINPIYGTINSTCSLNECIFNYPCQSTSSCAPYHINLAEGRYLLEVWGAEGGGNYSMGGKGGYSRGVITLSESTTLYLYLGAKGEYICNSGSFTKYSYNGGGIGYLYEYPGHCCGSGGGGSDFRVTESIYSRILVAGGGGGEASSTFSNDLNPGGYGGGALGGNGNCIANSSSYGLGANLSSPGLRYYGGSFGYGGNNTINPTSGGGGGGWFGGGAGYTNRASGGGGSGYFYSQYTLSPQNSGLNSDYYLESALLLSGNDLIPIPEGGYRIGHYGSGVGRITYLSSQECYHQSPNSLMLSSSIHQYLILFNCLMIYTESN